MKVGFYQFDIKFSQKEYNLNKVKNNLENRDFELMVLPELFTTGYLFSSKEELISLAENIPNGKTTKDLIKLAKKKNGYIVGGIAELDGEKVFNSAVVVGPQGYLGKHRKIHLTNFEKKLFNRGNDVFTFDINGVKIGVVVCFDCWFPELLRDLTFKGAQIICHPSNFGGTMSLEVIKVRAMENILFTITANRIGFEKGKEFDAEFCGKSQIVGPDWETLHQADNKERIHIMDIDPNRTKKKENIICDDFYNEINYYKNNCRSNK